MKSNIVLLGTYLSKATGIMYPCSYDRAGQNQSYIVFTCAHLFDGMENMPEDGNDIKKYINIQLFDDDGNLIDKDEIAELRYHIPRLENEKFCDIAVLLILIKPYKRISLETKIYNGELENRTKVYVEGYPTIMLDDEINKKIQLMGLSKELFPDREELGMYQIEDEYHWYNNFLDKKLLEGFSGSPIYVKTDKGVAIVGMNESVVNIEDGENPFKIVYYLKIKHILKILRMSECIFFVPEDDGSVQIDWVLDLKKEIMEKDKKALTLLMLGDSGAGKSSFARTFAYHAKNLMTTGGGQTTRTNVAYKFELFGGQNEAKVHFLPEDRFVDMMKSRNRLKGWNILFREITKTESISVDDTEGVFLTHVYKLLNAIKPEYNEDMLDYLLEKHDDIGYRKNIISIYDNLIKFFIQNVKIDQFPFELLLDREELEEIYCEYTKQVKSMNKQRGRVDNYEILKKLTEKIRVNDSVLFKKLHDSFDTDKFNWEKYCKKVVEYIKEDKVPKDDENVKHIYDTLQSEHFLQIYTKHMLYVEGFFALEEFRVSDINEILIGIREDLEKKKQEKERKKENEKDKRQNSGKIDLPKELDDLDEIIYRNAYHSIKKIIQQEMKKISKEESGNTILFHLNNMTPDEKLVLAKCLKVVKKESYTGMVQSVEIQDKVSDSYAMLLKKMGIKAITLLDTCGLNHVENDDTNIMKVRNVVTQYRDTGIVFEDVAILYIKKLDAGRPDELRNIIPVIVRALPKAPVYCVFTGIDIFYGNNTERMVNMEWEKESEENLPKPVRFIKNQDYEKILEGVNMRPARKKHFGLVLKNNLIAFCGDKELVDKNFGVFKINLKNIKKLLASISLDEYTSLSLIDPSTIEDKLNRAEATIEIGELLKLIFARASVKNWRIIHHTVSKANFIRIHNQDRDEMGYWGAYRHRWSQLFHDAYDDIVVGKNIDFLKLFDDNEAMAVEGALLKMADKHFLGEDNMLFAKRLAPGQEKNEFRLILEEMYKKERGLYVHNPFEDIGENIAFGKVDKNEAEIYLQDILDFEKGLEDEDILKKFTKCFRKALLGQITEDNKAKPQALLNINDDLRKAIDDLEKSFKTKFGDEYKVYSILIQYLREKS